jgi:cysteine desulfurase
MDAKVLLTLSAACSQVFANAHSSEHFLGWEASKAVEQSSAQIASAIGADADEIVFTSGATESNNLAVLGFTGATRRRKILVSAIEHKSILASARAAEEQYGIIVEILPVDKDGFIDLEHLNNSLDNNVLLTSIMAVNNEIGTIQPIKEIAKLVHAAGSILHSDGAQALSSGLWNLPDLGVDLISLSGHKIYGPKGIGALYIRRDLQSKIRPLIHGGGQQGNLRSGTLPVPLCLAFAEAVQIMSAAAEGGELERVRSLRDCFAKKLSALDQPVSFNGPAGVLRHPGNLNVRFEGFHAQELLGALQPKVAASMGSACTSGTIEPSHVLRAIGLSSPQADASIRFGFGRFSTVDQIDEAVSLLRDALARTPTLV